MQSQIAYLTVNKCFHGRTDCGVAKLDGAEADGGEARNSFADRQRMIEALDTGRAVFRKDMTPDEFGSVMNRMSPAEQDMAREGVRNAIEEVQGNATTGGAVPIFEKGWNQQRLAQVIGQDEADRFMQAVRRERAFADTRNRVTQGSDTAARHAAQKEFPNPVDNGPLPHMSVLDMARAAARRLSGGLVNARNAQVSDDAARALAATGAEHARLIQAMQDILAGRARAAELGDAARRAATVAVQASPYAGR